jgi:hypothetical protein
MAQWYFEDIEIGASRKAGPYLVSKNEIVQFAKQYDPVSSHIDRMLRRIRFWSTGQEGNRAPEASRPFSMPSRIAE